MAKNYEAICESLRLAGEQKLFKLSNTFQEHQQWLKQAFEDVRVQLGAPKELSQAAKPGRGRGASDKENALASKRSNRKRGAPATALDAITEEAEPDEKAIPEPEAPPQAEAALQKAPDISAQEASGARSKPPLPGRARRGRAARDEEGETDTVQEDAAAGNGSTEENVAAADTTAVAAQPQTVDPGRRQTRRTAKSGIAAGRPAEPARQTRRAAAVKAAAVISAGAAKGQAPEAKAGASADDAASMEADKAPMPELEEHVAAPEQGEYKEPAEHDEPAEEDDEQRPQQGSRGRKAKRQAIEKEAAAEEVPAEPEQAPLPSPGLAQAQRAGRRSAKSVAATPAERKQPAASAPRTTRRMAAAERAAAAKPDVQAHRLELSDEDSEEDLDVDGVEIEQDGAAIDNASPIAELEIAKELQGDEQREATPQAVENTPVQEHAAATAARPKRAAAAAAQRAIAATAVKKQRGRRISGASFASVPGTTRRTRQAAAAEEEARATPAAAAAGAADTGDDMTAANAEAADLQTVPQTRDLADDRDARDAEGAPNISLLPPDPQEFREAAKRQQIMEKQHSLPEPEVAELGTAAPDVAIPQLAAAELEDVEREDQAAAREEAAADPAQAEEPAGADAGVAEEMDEDIEVDFEDAQDVFNTPSQHPRMMTPGTSFGTACQQATAYKTGQEQMTGIHPSTGKPVFIRPDLRNGLLARAAAGAAAQRPAVPNGALSAQPQDSDQAAQAPETVTTAQAGGAVQRLKQQYEGTAPVEPAPLAEEASQGEQRKSSAAEPLPTADTSPGEAAEEDKEGPASAEEAAPAAQTGVAGMGANLVSTVRSFLPFVSKPGDAQPQPAAGKKPVKVKALEAAEAARRKEALKATERAAQRQQVEAQKAERAKRAQDAKAVQAEREEEARRLAQEALTKKEEEATARRHAKEEAEKREREERQKRQEELRQKRKQAEQERAAAEERSRKAAHEEEDRKRKAMKQQEMEAKRPRLQGPAAHSKPAPAAARAASQAAAPAVKMAGVDLPGPPQHTSGARPQAAESAADLASRPATAMPIQGVVKPSTPMAEIVKASAVDAARTGAQAAGNAAGAAAAQQGRTDSEQFQSYELSPYKSGSDSEDSEEEAEREKKPVPKWARGQALTQALVAQMAVDPDEIFKLHQKTCPLNEVFSDRGASEKHPRKDLNRRTSSGNWIEDRVTWKEELNYKKAMGYL